MARAYDDLEDSDDRDHCQILYCAPTIGIAIDPQVSAGDTWPERMAARRQIAFDSSPLDI